MSRIISFQYIVSGGDISPDLDYKGTSALLLNNGSIQTTSSSEDAILTLPTPSATDSLSFNKDLVIGIFNETDNINLQNIIIDGSGTITKIVSGGLDIPFIQISGSGKLLYKGSGDIQIPTVEAFATGFVNAVVRIGTGDLSIPFVTVDGQATLTRPDTSSQDKINELLKVEEGVNNIYAYDLDKKALTRGEATNERAINVSIENILSTLRGERLFNVNFGTILPLVSFEQLTIDNAEDLLDILLRAIRRYEKRVTVLPDKIELNIISDENAMTLVIPYIINRNGLESSFSKKVIL